MLSLHDHRPGRTRREFLRAGGLALGGLTLPELLKARAGAIAGDSLVHDRSVVFLFMHGGPSQYETFDPKMSAPLGIRSATGEIATRVPGTTFGSTFTKLASRADKFTVVRSFTTGDANHDIKPIVGRDTAGANLGSIYSRVAGMNHPRTGLPTNCALFPRAVEPKSQEFVKAFGNFLAPGPLGEAFSPFAPDGGGEMQQNLKLNLALDRLDDRRSLLSGLDRIKSSADHSGMFAGADRFRAQAFDTIASGVADAFDLSKEDPDLVAKYDTAPLVRPDQISRRWNNYNNYVDNATTIGRLMLLARRLCERGCGFVTVTTNFVWDMHADVNNATMDEGMRYMGLPFDHAVSTFIDDVEARGLSEKILLVCCGEMGRTPNINAAGGRDHWGNIAPLLLYGGGVPRGGLVGQSSRNGGEPATTPYTNRHLIGTILHKLTDVGQVRIARGMPVDIVRMTEYPTIPELFA